MTQPVNEAYVKSNYPLQDFVRDCMQGSFGNRWKRNYKDANRTLTVKFARITQVKLKYREGTKDTEKVHNFRVTVATKDEKGGRQKPVIILLSDLSLDASLKVRCGSLSSYRKGDDLVKKGICGDFYFLFMQVLADNKVLYNKNSTTGVAPSKTNSGNEVGVCKHLANAIRKMVETGFFGAVSNRKMRSELRQTAKKIG